jgi:drug/metabolite transporter (DMT)-like permease
LRRTIRNRRFGSASSAWSQNTQRQKNPDSEYRQNQANVSYNINVPQKSKKPKTKAAITGLAISNILSGSYTPIIKYCLRFMPLYNFGLIRHAGPAILMLPFMPKQWQPIKRRDLLLSILCGLILYCCANLFVYLGLQRTSSINAAIILMLEPILLFVFSVELMRERFKPKVFFGVLVAFLGTALIVMAPTLSTRSLSGGGFIGNLLILAAVACGVVGVWLMKYLSNRVPTFQLLFIGLIAAAFVYLLLALPTITEMKSLNNRVVLFGSLYGVIGVGIISYALKFWSLRRLGGQDYSLLEYVEPAATALVAFVFFKESFTSITLIGVAIVFVGVWLAEARARNHWHIHIK